MNRFKKQIVIKWKQKKNADAAAKEAGIAPVEISTRQRPLFAMNKIDDGDKKKRQEEEEEEEGKKSGTVVKEEKLEQWTRPVFRKCKWDGNLSNEQSITFVSD